MKILNKDIDNTTINKVVEMGYVNQRGFIIIIKGRLVDYNEKSLLLDVSENNTDMDLVEYEVNKISQYFRILQDNYWR